MINHNHIPNNIDKEKQYQFERTYSSKFTRIATKRNDALSFGGGLKVVRSESDERVEFCECGGSVGRALREGEIQ